jgi:hypothetical protein
MKRRQPFSITLSNTAIHTLVVASGVIGQYAAIGQASYESGGSA